MRNAITPRIAYYFPRTETGLQLNYRFYFDFYPGDAGTPSDPWLITSHMIEARMYQQLTPTLRAALRLPLLPPEPRQLLVRGADPADRRCRRRSSARWRPIRPPAT